MPAGKRLRPIINKFGNSELELLRNPFCILKDLPKTISLLVLMNLVAACVLHAEDFDSLKEKIQKQAQVHGVDMHFDVPYAGTENHKQMLDLYLPKNRASADPLPVVVFIHGGAWARGDRRYSSGDVFSLVKSGKYAGVKVSYRLSDEAKWPAQIHDCKAAIRWIRANAEKYGLDPEKIGVWGTSAGGHLVSLLGTSSDVPELEGNLGSYVDVSSRVACVVPCYAPQDFTIPMMFRDGEPVLEDKALVDLMGAPLADIREKLIAASPITYVTPDDPPFLIIHGTEDQRVDFVHAQKIHAALQEAGVSSILIPIEGGRHGAKHPELPGIIRNFFDKVLLGKDITISEEPLIGAEGADET